MGDTTAPTPPTVTTFHHMDDIEWTPVQRQRNADGSESCVRERWPIIRPGFLSAYVHYEPGMIVRRHGHRSNHVVVVLDGSGWLGGVPVATGSHMHVPLGASFGPIVAGPDGLTAWETSFGEFGGWGDQPELVEREFAARGVTPLPDPPLFIGDWFVDPRGDWGGERPSPKIDGLAEVLTAIDEVAPVAVADGVDERRMIDDPSFTSTILDLTPGASVDRAADGAHRLVWVVAGSVVVDGRDCVADTHIEVPRGIAFLATAGATGARLLELADA